LKIESVYPTLGLIGQDLDVNLKGMGFDENTRLSMSLDVGHRSAIIGSVDTPGDACGITIVGDTAYVADWDDGLKVIDISNPQNPQIIGSVDTPGGAVSVTVVGDIAYVADEYEGLQVIDISDPQNTQIIGSVDTPGFASGVAVVGDTAYVADGESGLQVIDISDPQSPQIIGSVDTPGGAVGVTVVGDMAYVADCWEGLQVIDISDPQNAQIIGSVYTPGSASGVTVVGDTAYIADYDMGLQVIDISDPQNPQIIGSLVTPGFALGVTVVGDTAYVADGSGLQVIDISDPQNPQIIGSFVTPGNAMGVTVVGDTAYVADSWEGLQVIDISDPQNPQIIGSVDTSDCALGVKVVGDTAYVADGNGGLQVIDISDPQNPQIIGSFVTPGFASGVTVVGDTAYVADYDIGLQVIDISDPQSPQIIGSVDTPGNALGVKVVGDTAYVADYDIGLQVINIIDPQSPQIIGSVDTPGFASGVTVVGDTAYVADGEDGGLKVIDVSDPQNPQIIGSVDTPGDAVGVTVVGDMAYVADCWEGLQVIDISDPQNPQIIGSVCTPGSAYAITLVGDMAYMADGSGLQVIDISDPQNPQIIGSVDTPGSAYAITLVGDMAYVANGLSGLVIVPIPIEISPITVNSTTSLLVTLPSPLIPGNYTLSAYNQTESYQLNGAVTFSTTSLSFSEPEPPPDVTPVSKVIIVAGGGPYEGNNLWEATRKCANYAYRVLLYQGYTREDIYYLTPENIDVDGNGQFDDVDADVTYDNLSWAINTWAQDPEEPASELLLYMTDHGGDGTFRLNQSSVLTAEELDDWLDDLQLSMEGKLIFIYDACRSGTFVSKLLPPEGKERIVITSASNETAYFINEGGLSFSFQFWASMFGGAELYHAFVFGKNMMIDKQSAIIEANGNGIGNEKDDKTLADNIVVGRGYIPASDMPFILSVSGEQILEGTSVATIQAVGVIDSDGIDRVWAVVTPPGFAPESPDTPVTDLPVIEMTDPDSDNTYEGQYNAFTIVGTYNITVFAMDQQGVYSLPEQTTVVQLVGEVGGGSIQLNSGWNLISLYHQVAYTDTSSVLSSISGKYVSVWAYTGGSWQVYDPENPGFSDLTTMDAGKGYWINMSEAGTLTISGDIPSNSIELATGWNLVGYNSSTSQAVENALASIESKYISVWAYMGNGWKVYDPANPGFSDLTIMEPGYGYWINASEGCIWTLP
jgi:hypothetical protein